MGKSIRSKIKKRFRTIKREKTYDGEVEKIKERQKILEDHNGIIVKSEEVVMEVETTTKSSSDAKDDDVKMVEEEEVDERLYPFGKPWGRRANRGIQKQKLKNGTLKLVRSKSKKRKQRKFW